MQQEKQARISLLQTVFVVLLLVFPAAAIPDDRDDDDGPVRYEFIKIFEDIFAPLAVGINDDRTVVGYGDPPNWIGLILEDGVVTTVKAPGADLTFLNGINNHGVIAGHSLIFNDDGSFADRGFLKMGDVYVDVTPPGTDGWAWGVNNRGNVVGIFCSVDGGTPGCGNDIDDQFSAYLLDRKGFHNIDPPGAIFSLGLGINDRKTTVGSYSQDFLLGLGFLRDRRGNFTDVQPPGALFTDARDVNNRGDVVGGFDDVNGTHGFLRKRNGEYITIDFPGEPRSILTGINNRGDLTGWVFDEDFFVTASFIALVQDDDDDDGDDEDDDDDDDHDDDEDDDDD